MTNKSNTEFVRKVRDKKPKTATKRKSTKNNKINNNIQSSKKVRKEFPTEFPFWARIKIDKNRTTLVIDEEFTFNKKTNKEEDMFVHREATHSLKKDFEEIIPNPDKDDPDPMYLKRPRKHPKRMFEPHNKNLSIPKHLKEKYSKE